MAAPVGLEAEIYKSPVKSAETRIEIQIDEPVFTSPFFDAFPGTQINPWLWDYRTYSWGNLTVAGGFLTVGVHGASIATPYVVSKPKLAFPKSKEFGWNVQMRHRFPAVNSHGNFVMIGSMETPWRVLSVEVWDGGGGPGGYARLEGLGVEADLTAWGVALGGYFRVQVSYDPVANTHSLWLDHDDDGIYNFVGSGSAEGRHPDVVVIGNSVAIQGGLADWTEINVDWIRVDGMSEIAPYPDWAGPMYMYDDIGYSDEVWAQLPSVTAWHSNHHKRNLADALTIDLANAMPSSDYPCINWLDLYSTYNFGGRQVRVDTRVRDGFGRWTSWKRCFTGIVDEQVMTENQNGDTTLQLRCRDIFRRQLAEHTVLARAYGDDTPAITGVINGLTAAQVIENILSDEIGLAPSQYYVEPCAGCLKPKTYNIAGRPASDVIDDLRQQLAYSWYPRKSDGRLMVQDLFWGTGSPDYVISDREEVESASWARSAWRYVAGVVFSIDNTEFLDGGFSTQFPIAPIPFYGDKINVSSQICPDDSCLRLGRPLHYLHWRQANRELGSIEVTMTCQDWIEHDMEIVVLGTRLGLDDSKVWIVDGWDYTFTASGFTTRLHLIDQATADLVRNMVLSNRAGWQ